MTPARALREDAARNREALLAAAEAEFAEHGAEASVADIARRAGVAKGTVFRHFASKEALMAAIVGTHLAALTAEAERLLATPDPEAALLELLTVIAAQRQQHDLECVQSMTEADAEVTAERDRLFRAIEALVDEARASGVVRDDVTGTDVILMSCAPLHVVDFLPDPAPDQWRRYLAIMFDGLRPAGASPLPVGPPGRLQG
jgi:AcrR family transcriptional regulator